jgi:predicted permease
MSIVSDVVERVRALVFRQRADRELREELEFHVRMEAEQQQRAGVDASEARRRGMLALGGMTRTAEEVRDARGTRGTTDMVSDMRYALRMLRQRPGFTLVAMLTIAIGVAGTTAVFSTFDTVILRALPYQRPGQLVRLYKTDDGAPDERSVVSPVHFLQYRARFASMQRMAAMNLYDKSGADIGSGSDVRRIRTEIVSSGYFKVLGTPPLLGRGFTVDEETGVDDDTRPGRAVVVLSNRMWRDRFHGSPQAIGASLVMSGVPHIIVGVMPPAFADPVLGPEVDAWVPLNLTPGKDISNAGDQYLSVIGRLAPGVTLGRAQAELDGLGRQLKLEYATQAPHTLARLYPLKDDVVSGARGSLQLILGAVVLVLVLVCVNIANLLLVRSSERAREFAMRAALGARRGRLVRQLLTEGLVLALGGALLAVPIAEMLMTGIKALGASSIPRLDGLHLDLPMLGFAATVAVACAVLFSVAPAWRAAHTDPADVLRRSGRSITGDRAQGRWRTALVVSQVTLAFVLLAGAGVLIASFRKLHDVPLGVTADGVLTFRIYLPDVRYDSLARTAFHHRFDAALTALPGVRAAGATSWLPATGSYHSWGVRALSGPLTGTDAANRGAEQRIVTPGYFGALGLRVLAGRVFDARDNAAAPDRVVISKAFADALYPHVSAIGQRLRTGGHNSDVIGVVNDAAIDPTGTTAFTVYHVHDQFSGDRNWALYEVVAVRGAMDPVTQAARRTLAAIDPALVLDQPASLDDVIGKGTAQRAFTLKVLMAFSLTALLLAALGIFGVLSYTVRLRRTEFGVRMTLGATPAQIRTVVIRQALTVCAVGVVFGVVGSLALSRVMATMVFRMSPADPRVLLVVAAVMAIIATGAAYLPARRATSVEPREVLE